MYKNEPYNIQVLGIGVDMTPSQVSSWVRVYGWTFPALVDDGGLLWQAYNSNDAYQINVVLDQCRTLRFIEQFAYHQSTIADTIRDAYSTGPLGDTCDELQDLFFPDLVYSTTSCLMDRYTSEDVDTDGPERIYEFTLDEPSQVYVLFDGFFGGAIYVRTSCGSHFSEIGFAEADVNGEATLDLGERSAGTYYVFVDGLASYNKGMFRLRVTDRLPSSGGGGGGGGGCSTVEGAGIAGSAHLLALLLVPMAFAWILRRRA